MAPVHIVSVAPVDAAVAHYNASQPHAPTPAAEPQALSWLARRVLLLLRLSIVRLACVAEDKPQSLGYTVMLSVPAKVGFLLSLTGLTGLTGARCSPSRLSESTTGLQRLAHGLAVLISQDADAHGQASATP